MPPTTHQMNVANCPCGRRPITAWGERDGFWTVVVCCREPENHTPLNECFCIVTRNQNLADAIAEAEEMWRSLWAPRTSRTDLTLLS